MAEALGIVSVVASVVQLVDVGSRILTRLEEYSSRCGELPEAFRHINIIIPPLLDALQRREQTLKSEQVPNKPVCDAINELKSQIEGLEKLVTKALPAQGNTRATRMFKAIGSLRYDGKVEKIGAVIDRYIRVLTFDATVASGPDTPIEQPRPPSTSNVPLRRDPDYIDRNIFDSIDKICRNPASRAAIVGLGGVGKSQLAVEYSYRTRDKSPETWVFWVHAGTTARLEEGYRNIAERVRIPGWDQQNANVMHLVFKWLSDETNGSWFMILDNADELSVFCSRRDGKPDLLRYLPQSANGSILVTSRSRDVSYRIVGSYQDIVDIGPMEHDHAVALLKKKLPEYTQADAEELVSELDCMPLAISQATAFISQMSPRLTVSKYLEAFRKSDADRTELLAKDIPDFRRDGEQSNSIIKTLHISFEHIRQASPSAARLLSLMCLFNRQGIPEDLLDGKYDEDGITSNFEEDWAVLSSYSLIKTSADGNNFEMHRLVQLSTRNWLVLQAELRAWTDRHICLIAKAFPAPNGNTHRRCEALLIHAQTASRSENTPDDKEVLLVFIHLQTNVGSFFVTKGQYSNAEEMFRLALVSQCKVHRPDHKGTIHLQNLLARMLVYQKRLSEAERTYQEVIFIQQEKYGKDHESLWKTVSGLGELKRKSRHLEEAESLLRQALAIREKSKGSEDRRYLALALSLGRVLMDQGRYNDAGTILYRTQGVLERKYSSDRSLGVEARRNISRLLLKQERYKDAEEMFKKQLAIVESIWGTRTIKNPNYYGQIGFSVYLQRRYGEALQWYERAYAGYVEILGHCDPLTQSIAQSINKLKGKIG